MLSQLYDLHTHTNQSDGSLAPEALVKLARQRDLAGIAITDHDEIGAIDRAIQKGKKTGIEVIPGLELSASLDEYDVHILGYFIDYQNAGLLGTLDYLRSERVKRMYRILEKLKDVGVPLARETVLMKAGQGCVGRPHVAAALYDEGHVVSFQAAFDLYLAEGKPAFEPKTTLSPEEAIKIIHDAGGIASLAHPGLRLTKQVILSVIDAGVDAIETIHPKHSIGMTIHFERLAEDKGLLTTAGSDFHGGKKGYDKFGKFYLEVEKMDRIKNYAKRRIVNGAEV